MNGTTHTHNSWINLRSTNQHIEIVIQMEGNPRVKSVIIIEDICAEEGCYIGRDGAEREFDVRQRIYSVEGGRRVTSGLLGNSKEG